jgi:hypothetical protein
MNDILADINRKAALASFETNVTKAREAYRKDLCHRQISTTAAVNKIVRNIEKDSHNLTIVFTDNTYMHYEIEHYDCEEGPTLGYSAPDRSTASRLGINDPALLKALVEAEEKQKAVQTLQLHREQLVKLVNLLGIEEVKRILS